MVLGQKALRQDPAHVFHQAFYPSSSADSGYTLGVSPMTQPAVLPSLPQGLTSSLPNHNLQEPYKSQAWQHLSSETGQVGVQTLQEFLGHNGTPNFRAKVMLSPSPTLSPPIHSMAKFLLS